MSGTVDAGSSPTMGGATGAGASPTTGGTGGTAGAGSSPTTGGAAGAGAFPPTGETGGATTCVGETDDTEPNDSVATAYDLGVLEPDFADDCGGTTPQVSFDGATGPGDPDYAKGVGAEKNVKCGHRPELFVFEKTNVNGCLVAKCDAGTATYTCQGGAGVDLGNGYDGRCGDLSKAISIELVGFSCSGNEGSAKLFLRISPLTSATTCEPYGVLVIF